MEAGVGEGTGKRWVCSNSFPFARCLQDLPPHDAFLEALSSGRWVKAVFLIVTEHHSQGLLCTLRGCVTPLRLEGVCALTATCSEAPVPGQLTGCVREIWLKRQVKG